MQLINSTGPNPRMVRMYLLEKGLTLPMQTIDIRAGDNRKPDYLERNPTGQTPALVLDDGRCISETVAICEYLEEAHPAPPLIGSTAEERAETRMWIRRIEGQITNDMYSGFRYGEGLAMFKHRMHCMPEAADTFKHRGQLGLAWLDGQLDGRAFICGDRFSIADIALYCCLDFVGSVGQPLDTAHARVGDWFARIAARDSAEASLSPDWQASGMRV